MEITSLLSLDWNGKLPIYSYRPYRFGKWQLLLFSSLLQHQIQRILIYELPPPYIGSSSHLADNILTILHHLWLSRFRECLKLTSMYWWQHSLIIWRPRSCSEAKYLRFIVKKPSVLAQVVSLQQGKIYTDLKTLFHDLKSSFFRSISRNWELCNSYPC